MSELLSRGELNQSQRKFSDFIKLSSAKLLEIINDILDIAKLETGKVHIKNTEFNITNLLEYIINLFIFEAQQKCNIINYRVDEDIPKLLIGDELKIRQILINIINNSIKFTHHGSINVDVKCKEICVNEIQIEFSVKDDGIGIDKNIQNIIFEPFLQGDQSYTKKYQGTGLGLAIRKKLVEILNGTINFESTLGKGSRFYFIIKLRLLSNPPK